MNRSAGQAKAAEGGRGERRPVVVYSTLGDDPRMRVFLEEFIADVPNRLQAIHATCQRGDMAGMSHLATLLKGTAAGFGYGEISQAADQLSQLSMEDVPVERIKQALLRLASLYEAALRGLEWSRVHQGPPEVADDLADATDAATGAVVDAM